MPYTSGPRPTRLSRPPPDLRSLGWRAYTLVEQPGASRDTVTVGCHSEAITSVAVIHRLPITGRASLRNKTSPQRWHSVITSLTTAPDAITNIHEAMNCHIALNTANRERWSSTHQKHGRIDSLIIEGRDVPVITRQLDGLTVIGMERDETRITVVVPNTAIAAITLELVRL